MKQASQPGFYEADDGTEVYVPAGVVRSDGHPDVLRVPQIFRDLPEEDAPGPKKARARHSKDDAADGES